jgi:hypothetical protein
MFHEKTIQLLGTPMYGNPILGVSENGVYTVYTQKLLFNEEYGYQPMDFGVTYFQANPFFYPGYLIFPWYTIFIKLKSYSHAMIS